MCKCPKRPHTLGQRSRTHVYACAFTQCQLRPCTSYYLCSGWSELSQPFLSVQHLYIPHSLAWHRLPEAEQKMRGGMRPKATPCKKFVRGMSQRLQSFAPSSSVIHDSFTWPTVWLNEWVCACLHMHLSTCLYASLCTGAAVVAGRARSRRDRGAVHVRMQHKDPNGRSHAYKYLFTCLCTRSTLHA